MNIIEFKAQNFKKLKAVTIKPDGPMVMIGGRNAQGKSSVLDGILATLCGTKNVPEVAVRKGQERASTEVNLGELAARRTYNANGGGTLVVRRANGDRPSSPQQILDQLVGKISFDPLQFCRDPQMQLVTLRTLAGVDWDTYKAARQKLYDQRSDVNRELKQHDAAIARLAPQVPDDLPEQGIEPAQMLAEMEAVNERNKQRDAEYRRRVGVVVQIDEYSKRIKEITAEIARLQNELCQVNANRDALEKAQLAWPELPEPESTEHIHQMLREAGQINAGIGKRAELRKAKSEADQCAQKSAELTEQLNQLDAKIQQQIADANLPVDGLGFDENGATYNGLPLAQASSAEQLRVSVALAIKSNPDLQVMLIRDGSLLDKENLKLIAEMAEQSGHQVWIERVGDEGATVVLEDGEVREQELKY